MPKRKADRGPWILTFSGRRFHLIDPQPEEIVFADIAHALGHICRFTGHTVAFYSVAEHSLLCREAVKAYGGGARLELFTLLHDAAEAYVGDVSSPLRSLLPDHKKIERRVMWAICKAFGLPTPTKEESAVVKKIDDLLVVSEGAVLMRADTADWGVPASPDPSIIQRIRNLSPQRAAEEFRLTLRDVCASLDIHIANK